MIVFALEKADKDLRRLIEIRCGDEQWDDVDVHIDFAVELALTHCERMKSMSFNEFSDFAYEWHKLAAVVRLGKSLFSRSDCWYSSALESVCSMFEQMVSLVEFVSDGSKD